MVKTLLKNQGGRGDHDGDGYVVGKTEYEEFCEFRASRAQGMTADPAGQTEEGTVAAAAAEAAGSTAAAASTLVCNVAAVRGSTGVPPAPPRARAARAPRSLNAPAAGSAAAASAAASGVRVERPSTASTAAAAAATAQASLVRQRARTHSSVARVGSTEGAGSTKGSKKRKRPLYQLSRTLTSIKEVYVEYSTGLPGQPSIRSLEQEYGSGWHSQGRVKSKPVMTDGIRIQLFKVRSFSFIKDRSKT